MQVSLTSHELLALIVFQDAANGATTPAGYASAFQNGNASINAPKYMGSTALKSYDLAQCAAICDKSDGCNAFNVFFERAPSMTPDAKNCPNPPSTTYIKCSLWGNAVSVQQATNSGQWRDNFQVVITGSNGRYARSVTTACG